MLDEIPGVEFSGVVQRVAQDHLKDVPRELSTNNGGGGATKTSAAGGQQPMLTYYEATVAIKTEGDRRVLTGFRGTAKVRIDRAPLGQRLIRYFQQVIHFR